jgi:hypothetical protein
MINGPAPNCSRKDDVMSRAPVNIVVESRLATAALVDMNIPVNKLNNVTLQLFAIGKSSVTA